MLIVNIDEQGNEIEDINWDTYKRVSIETTRDDDGTTKIISHCQKLSNEELNVRLLAELAATEGTDIEAALCELAEQQAAYEDDVNAALCELYELIAGGGETTNG